MLTRKAFVTAAFLTLPFSALAQSEGQLVDRYKTFAGSEENATQLVTGMREGKTVTLKSGTTTQTIVFTEKMGYGNIDNALALAQASLGKTTATPAQINAALTADTYTVNGKTYDGILKMRYEDKMGWGEIAHALGFKSLGEIKRSDKASPPTKTSDQTARAERGSRPEKPERPQRPDKPDHGGGKAR